MFVGYGQERAGLPPASSLDLLALNSELLVRFAPVLFSPVLLKAVPYGGVLIHLLIIGTIA